MVCFQSLPANPEAAGSSGTTHRRPDGAPRHQSSPHPTLEHPMATSALANGEGERLDLADVRRRVKAIFIGSVGNLVEWYDFYAYAAFALYFASSFFPGDDPVVQQLNAAILFA